MRKNGESVAPTAGTEGTQKGFVWNAGASEFVPPAHWQGEDKKVVKRSTIPAVQGEGTKTMTVNADGVLRWVVDEKWTELKDMPKDFSVASPQFDVDDVKNLQLSFFPTGRSAAEFSGCSLQLTTGTLPSDMGIKFQVKINGIGLGEKTCLKKRFVGDFPKLDEKRTKEVAIEITILELFQEKNYKMNM